MPFVWRWDSSDSYEGASAQVEVGKNSGRKERRTASLKVGGVLSGVVRIFHFFSPFHGLGTLP